MLAPDVLALDLGCQHDLVGSNSKWEGRGVAFDTGETAFPGSSAVTG